MVNPLTYPTLRRGNSGPLTEVSAGSSEPFDNNYYFDPDFVDSLETGAITGPFTTWAQWAAAAAVGVEGVKVWFPGYPVTPGADVIPVNNDIVLEGVSPSSISSAVSDSVELESGTGTQATFRSISINALNLAGGETALLFDNAVIGDLLDLLDFAGVITGFNTHFVFTAEVPTSEVLLYNCKLQEFEAGLFYLHDCTVGIAGLAGALSTGSTVARCVDTTFADGSTVTFTGAAGILYLDAWSYKSFNDGGSSVVNGVVELVGGAAGLTSDDISNVSTVDGANVTAALETLGLGTLDRGPDILGTVNTTLEREDGTVFVMLPDVATAPRTVTAEDSGALAPVNTFNFVCMIYPQDFDISFVSGPNAFALLTWPAGLGGLIYLQFDGINFFLAGLGDLA